MASKFTQFSLVADKRVTPTRENRGHVAHSEWGNRGSADFMISSPLLERQYYRLVPEYDEYQSIRTNWIALVEKENVVSTESDPDIRSERNISWSSIKKHEPLSTQSDMPHGGYSYLPKSNIGRLIIPFEISFVRPGRWKFYDERTRTYRAHRP